MPTLFWKDLNEVEEAEQRPAVAARPAVATAAAGAVLVVVEQQRLAGRTQSGSVIDPHRQTFLTQRLVAQQVAASRYERRNVVERIDQHGGPVLREIRAKVVQTSRPAR